LIDGCGAAADLSTDFVPNCGNGDLRGRAVGREECVDNDAGAELRRFLSILLLLLILLLILLILLELLVGFLFVLRAVLD